MDFSKNSHPGRLARLLPDQQVHFQLQRFGAAAEFSALPTGAPEKPVVRFIVACSTGKAGRSGVRAGEALIASGCHVSAPTQSATVVARPRMSTSRLRTLLSDRKLAAIGGCQACGQRRNDDRAARDSRDQTVRQSHENDRSAGVARAPDILVVSQRQVALPTAVKQASRLFMKWRGSDACSTICLGAARQTRILIDVGSCSAGLCSLLL